MAGGTLNYRIELDAAEAQAALQGLQAAGSDLFRTLEQASASLTRGGGFATFATTIAAAGAAVVGLTGSLFAMANASAQTVDELGELASQVGSSVEEISTLRSALVQLEANGETLQRAFLRMGNTISEMWPGIQKSVSGAAQQIASDQLEVEQATQSLAKAQIEAAGSSDMVAKAYLAVEQAALALKQAQQRVAETTDNEQKNQLDLQQALLAQQQTRNELARFSQDAAQQQINSSLNIASAIQGEADAQIALDQAKGKFVSAETLRQNTIKRAELALQAAQERRAEAEAKAAREQEDLGLRRQQLVLQQQAAAQAVADAEKKQALEGQQLQLVQLQLQQAQIAQREAIRKAQEAEIQSGNNLLSVHEKELKLAAAREKQRRNELNSIDNIAARMNALAAGTTRGLGEINTSVDDLIKGLIASVGGGVTALEGLGGSFGEIQQRAPGMVPVLLKLADVFKNMEDGALKLSIATKLFGRKDAVDMVEALSKGSAEILRQQERMRSLGLVITETDKTITEKFIGALNRLKEAISIVATQLGLLFQPAFTEAMERIAEAVENNRARILEWGASIRDAVVPILETFVRVLLGIPEAGKDDWLVSYINNIKAFGSAVQSIITNVIIPAFTALLVVTGGIAKGINAVFGTELNAFDILLTAWLAKILGAFRLFAFGVSQAGIATIIAWGPVLIVLGLIAAAILLIIIYWPQVWAAAQESARQILAAWEIVKQFFIDWVTTPVANAWEWIKTTFNDAVEWVMRKANELSAWLAEKFATSPERGGSVTGPGTGFDVPPGAGPFAHGGRVGGRGTGTSDSNLAWVSRGEHIMPARAVRQPGVLAFLEALRRSGGNLSRVLDGMGRFALGGMVPAMPAFAGSGLNGGMSNVTIQFPGLPAIGGLRASSEVVDELRKAAALAQVRSGGRKPSRYS